MTNAVKTKPICMTGNGAELSIGDWVECVTIHGSDEGVVAELLDDNKILLDRGDSVDGYAGSAIVVNATRCFLLED